MTIDNEKKVPELTLQEQAAMRLGLSLEDARRALDPDDESPAAQRARYVGGDSSLFAFGLRVSGEVARMQSEAKKKPAAKPPEGVTSAEDLIRFGLENRR